MATKFKQGLDVEGPINLSGDITIGGNAYGGDSDTDNITFTADINSNIVPNTTTTYDLGLTNKRWRNLYGEDVNLTGDVNAVDVNASGNMSAVNLTLTGIITAPNVDTGPWTITESGGKLYFAYNGTNKMSLDSSGNLVVVGDITAFGTIT